MKESCEYCVNENKKLKYAFDLYKDSAEDVKARLKAELIKANGRSSKLKQKAIAGWFTAAIFAVVAGCLL